MLSINQKHSFCSCVQWRFSFGQTILATSSRSVCWPVKPEFFCMFAPSKSQPSKVSHLAKWYYSSFVAFSLHVVQSGPLIPSIQMGVHVCWVLFPTKFIPFGAEIFLNNPVVLFEPMATIPFQPSHVKILTRCPGKVENDAVPWYNGAWYVQPMSLCSLPNNARQSNA